jgi:hypothetical protein
MKLNLNANSASMLGSVAGGTNMQQLANQSANNLMIQ